MISPPECQKVRRYAYSYTQYRHWTDRQTDRIGKTISRSACTACWRAIKTAIVAPVDEIKPVDMTRVVLFTWICLIRSLRHFICVGLGPCFQPAMYLRLRYAYRRQCCRSLSTAECNRIDLLSRQRSGLCDRYCLSVCLSLCLCVR